MLTHTIYTYPGEEENQAVETVQTHKVKIGMMSILVSIVACIVLSESLGSNLTTLHADTNPVISPQITQVPTLTSIVTLTPSPSITLTPIPTLTNTPTPTLTPTPFPTYTPWPTFTPWPTRTPTPTRSPTPAPRNPMAPNITISYPLEMARIVFTSPEQKFCITDEQTFPGEYAGIQRKHNINDEGWSPYISMFTLCFEPQEGKNTISVQYMNEKGIESSIYTRTFNFHRSH
jgi:hypothetical protein